MLNPTARRVELLIVEDNGKVAISCLKCKKIVLKRLSFDLELDPTDGILLAEVVSRHECCAPHAIDETKPD